MEKINLFFKNNREVQAYARTQPQNTQLIL